MSAIAPAESSDGVVQLNVLGRDIWYDIRAHRVLRWQEERNGTLTTGHLHAPADDSRQGGCNSCSSAPMSGRTAPAHEDLSDVSSEDEPILLDDAEPAAERITTIELHLNDKCNFRCSYCYLTEAGIEYLDNEMPDAVAFKAVDFLVANLRPKETGLIKFFGGEPLMSFPLLQRIVTYAEERAGREEKRVLATINTNGTLLTDDRIEWLLEHQVKVTISIDGKEESHNRYRKYVGGNRTFAAVAKKARKFFEKAGYLRIRSTISDREFDIPNSVLELSHLAGTPNKVQLQTDCNYIGDKKIDGPDVARLNEDHNKLALIWLERLRKGETIKYANFVEPMFTMLKSVKSSYRCGAARTLVGVSPAGDMYPCHRFVEVKELQMGHIDSGVSEEVRDSFRQNRVELKEPCRDCWARYFCGGGCAHNNFFTSRNIRDGNDVYCQIFRHQVKLGLYIHTELTREEGATVHRAVLVRKADLEKPAAQAAAPSA